MFIANKYFMTLFLWNFLWCHVSFKFSAVPHLILAWVVMSEIEDLRYRICVLERLGDKAWWELSGRHMENGGSQELNQWTRGLRTSQHRAWAELFFALPTLAHKTATNKLTLDGWTDKWMEGWTKILVNYIITYHFIYLHHPPIAWSFLRVFLYI